jgi:hypothetical protein
MVAVSPSLLFGGVGRPLPILIDTQVGAQGGAGSINCGSGLYREVFAFVSASTDNNLGSIVAPKVATVAMTLISGPLNSGWAGTNTAGWVYHYDNPATGSVATVAGINSGGVGNNTIFTVFWSFNNYLSYGTVASNTGTVTSLSLAYSGTGLFGSVGLCAFFQDTNNQNNLVTGRGAHQTFGANQGGGQANALMFEEGDTQVIAVDGEACTWTCSSAVLRQIMNLPVYGR